MIKIDIRNVPYISLLCQSIGYRFSFNPHSVYIYRHLVANEITPDQSLVPCRTNGSVLLCSCTPIQKGVPVISISGGYQGTCLFFALEKGCGYRSPVLYPLSSGNVDLIKWLPLYLLGSQWLMILKNSPHFNCIILYIELQNLIWNTFKAGLYICQPNRVIIFEIHIYSSKVGIWHVNCGRAITPILDSRTDVLGKLTKFRRHNVECIYIYI